MTGAPDRCVECNKPADVNDDMTPLCAQHFMRRADLNRRGPLYWESGWSDAERKTRVQAKQEKLRDEILHPDRQPLLSPEQKDAIRKYIFGGAK